MFTHDLESNRLSVTAVRKLFETLAFVIAGVALVSLGYINNIPVAVTVMTVAISASGFSNVGKCYLSPLHSRIQQVIHSFTNSEYKLL